MDINDPKHNLIAEARAIANVYRLGKIERFNAIKQLEPIVSQLNIKVKEIAKKYKITPKLFNPSKLLSSLAR